MTQVDELRTQNKMMHIVVLDYGSLICKATLVGAQDQKSICHRRATDDEEDAKKFQFNYFDMEHFYQTVSQCLDDLKVAASETCLLICDHAKSSLERRQQMCTVLFELLQVAQVRFCNQALLACIAHNMTTGIVVDSGHSFTSVVPLFDGYAVHSAVQCIPHAGKRVANVFRELLVRKTKNNKYGSTLISALLEKMAYVAQDFDHEMAHVHDKLEQYCYELPDKQSVNLVQESFMCTEVLFQPSAFEYDYPSVQELIVKAIKLSDMDIRKALFANIVTTGGNTMYSGYQSRLKQEVKQMTPNAVHVHHNQMVPLYTNVNKTCHGGTILAMQSMHSKSKIWITQKEYKERGSIVVKYYTEW